MNEELAIWPFAISSITVQQKKSSSSRREKIDTETWILRISPGNEFYAGESQVVIMWKGTHPLVSGKMFQDLLKDKTFKEENGIKTLEILDIPDDIKYLNSQHAWDENPPLGTTGLAFASIPFNPEDPTEEYLVWDPEQKKAITDKNGNKLVHTRENICTICVKTPQGWKPPKGTDPMDGLRAELSEQISRKRFRKLKSSAVDVKDPAKEEAEVEHNDGD